MRDPQKPMRQPPFSSDELSYRCVVTLNWSVSSQRRQDCPDHAVTSTISPSREPRLNKPRRL